MLTKSRYMMKFQATAGLNSNYLELRGPIDIANKDFVAEFDSMVDDKWAPKIPAKDDAVKSILLACRAVGYCNLLIYVKLQNKSDPPLHEQNLNPIFAYFVTMRIKDIVANVMNSARSVQYELNAESRSFMFIWYRYSSIMRAQLQRLDHCELFVSLTTLYSLPLISSKA